MGKVVRRDRIRAAEDEVVRASTIRAWGRGPIISVATGAVQDRSSGTDEPAADEEYGFFAEGILCATMETK